MAEPGEALFVLRRLGLRIGGQATGVIMARYVQYMLEIGSPPVFDGDYVTYIADEVWESFLEHVNRDHLAHIRWINCSIPVPA